MLHVEITTVERKVFSSDSVQKITIPTQDGIITIYPNHEPLMSVLAMGEVLVYENEAPTPIFVDGGVLQINHNSVDLLTQTAERAEELDEARIEEARRRAEKILQEQPVDVDLAKVETALQQELMKQKLVKKWRQYR